MKMTSKCINGDDLKTKDFNFQATSKYDYVIERIFLISIGLISILLINQGIESFFPHLAEIPRSSYFEIMIKYFRGHALSNQDEINFLIPALYFLLVLYFVKVFHDLQISIPSFLILFALWIILILILNTTILEYPLTILTIFLINLINHVLPEEQIAGQELIINSFYILSSFCLFKALMLSVVSISNSTRGYAGIRRISRI